MQICNNSNIEFQVKISSEWLGDTTKTIKAHSRLNLSDFFPSNIVDNIDLKIKYKIEVLYNETTLQKYSHVPQEVYVALLDPKANSDIPRVIVYLDGEKRKRHIVKMTKLANTLIHTPISCSEKQVQLVLEKISEHKKNWPGSLEPDSPLLEDMFVRNLFDIIYSHYHEELLKHMSLPQMWAAIKKIRGADENLIMSSQMQREFLNLIHKTILTPDIS